MELSRSTTLLLPPSPTPPLQARLTNSRVIQMILNRPEISENLTKEEAILYYLFIDDQLLCAWWDYLEAWELVKETELEESQEFKQKIDETMAAVNYWEEILHQLKKTITYEDIEEFVSQNPDVTKSYLFSR